MIKVARNLKTPVDQQLFRILFYPKQDKFIVYKTINKNLDVVHNQHYTLANGDRFYNISVEATNPVQALGLAIYKLEAVKAQCEDSLL
jgi:hypothetical protein